MEVKKEVQKIQERNKKVEADKAWELSKFRKFIILLFTYLIALVFMMIVELERPWIGACVPTLGYFLSTLTIPPLKNWWIKKFL